MGVENIIGVGVVNKDAKSRSRAEGRGTGVGVLSTVGEAGSDKVDDTERRFVRAGVRIECAGGALDPEELDQDNGDSLRDFLLSSSSSSITVAG